MPFSDAQRVSIDAALEAGWDSFPEQRNRLHPPGLPTVTVTLTTRSVQYTSGGRLREAPLPRTPGDWEVFADELLSAHARATQRKAAALLATLQRSRP